MRCPCQSGESYENCCAKFIRSLGTDQQLYPPTAEALMRSRFSAFAVGDASYLLHTWHPSTRPASLQLDADQQWYLLEILGTSAGGLFDSQGVVSFRAHYRSAANRKLKDSLTETSSFVREGRQWLYVEALELL
ncbi:MAG: YchJ family metal-binding protein [Arthrobacter sp.]|nr:YchJ family metal-binding protein [Arthrobacter sp.]MDO5753117.1 YchJ family metal-binding protein [Arthrobacter sp.]